MRKKIVIISTESIIAGNAKTGVADLTDGLANALSPYHNITIICPDGKGSIAPRVHAVQEGFLCKFNLSQVNYILIEPTEWENEYPSVIESIQPDILHNLAHPNIIDHLISRPNKTIYTIDCASYIQEKIQYLLKYDYLTTVSKNYAQELLNKNNKLSEILKQKNFRGITNGITTVLCDPSTGLMIPNAFNISDLSGKNKCKQALLKKFNISGNPPIYSIICRLEEEKGISTILNNIDYIHENGGIVLIYGKGNLQFEEAIIQKKNKIIWINEKTVLQQALPILAGSDFYLSPSKEEACGLMQMTASLYGTIPIVTEVGGLKDNFNDTNAIIIKDSFTDAIDNAIKLYKNNFKLSSKRIIAMKSEFDWSYRIQDYLDLYNE